MIKAIIDTHGEASELARFELRPDGTIRSTYANERFRATIEQGMYCRGAMLFPEATEGARHVPPGLRVEIGKPFWDALERFFWSSSFITVKRIDG